MKQYEDFNICRAESNEQVARHVASALGLPSKLVLKAVLPETKREAMGLPKLPKPVRCLILAALKIRRHLVRYVCLPRVKPVSLTGDPNTDDEGCYRAHSWSTHPWYVRSTLWSRYGPSAWIKRVLGNPCPGDDGDKYHPEGYTPIQIGPAALRGKGCAFVEAEKERLEKLDSSACPFLAAAAR